jgi:glycerophosphoryl diester phosphodiesterase
MTMIEERLFVTDRAVPLRFAPHGLSANHPEGSLAAFGVLKAEDWDGFSVHVYQIATGELVAFPEESLARLTSNKEAKIWELSLEEVKALEISTDNGKGGIPLLQEVLQALPGSLIHLHCEGGFYGESTAATEIAKLVAESKLEESVLLTSPYLLSLRSYVLDNEELAHGWRFDRQLFGGPVKLEEHPILEILRGDIVVCLGTDFLDKDNVSALQERGLAVGTIYLEKEEDVKRACVAGVDWVVSAQPLPKEPSSDS